MTCEAAFIKGVIPSELGIFKSIPSSIRIFKVLRSPWATANIAADLESKVRTDGVKILEEDEHTQPKFKLEKKMFIQKCVLHNNNNDKIAFRRQEEIVFDITQHVELIVFISQQ